jgi:hypothetical protein
MDIAEGKVTAHKDPKLPTSLPVPNGPSWAEGYSIAQEDANTLLVVIRTLYPHDTLPDHIYRRVVLHIARLGAAEKLASFIQSLNTAWPLPFTELAETYRVQILKTVETRPEFTVIQRLAVRYLYDDVEVWAAFGYEGAAVHLGGYLKRGFDDLDWLPPLPNDL